jgi:hypothetical protein
VRWIFLLLVFLPPLWAGCWDNFELAQPDLESPPVYDLAVPAPRD